MLTVILGKVITFILGICLLIIFYCFIHRIYILWLYRSTLQIKEQDLENFFSELPTVTIQLPVFNESCVVERLIENICSLDYPANKLEIQVLDDSSDETTDIIHAICEKKRAEGINIYQVRRETRVGYKAGALQHALQLAKGEFIAIFDADFLPPIDFLNKTIHYFTDEKMGWLQTRWSHLNEHFSLLTECIALFCDALFKIECFPRNKAKHWGIFNGTAGIIRRSMIEEVDGWQWDTITEDSDLSYRGLLMGWKYKILTDVECPCELPPTLGVFVEQQRRWAKGNIQVIKKLSRKIFSANVSISNKYDFISYLTSYLCLPALTILSLLIMPYLVLNHLQTLWGINISLIIRSFLLGLASIVCGVAILFLFFKFAQKNQEKNSSYILYRTLLFIFMSIGLSPFITIAIFEGFLKKDNEFIRTPKFNIRNENQYLIKNELSTKLSKIGMAMLFLGFYTVVSLYMLITNYVASGIQYVPILMVFSLAYFYFGCILAFPSQRWLKNIYEMRAATKDLLVEHSSSGINYEK